MYGEDLKDGISSQLQNLHVGRPKSRQNFKVASRTPKNENYGVSYQVEVPKLDESEIYDIVGRSSPSFEPTFNSPHLEFDVFLAGNLIYSKRETGRFPLSGDIISKIRA